MRLLVQRIKEARVSVDGTEIGKAGVGLCLFLGVAREDTTASADRLADKIAELRIFEDENGNMNHSVKDLRGEILLVSEFTLYSDCSKGRRPSFSRAAPPEQAHRLYDYFVQKLKDLGLRVETGKFQAKMEVSLDRKSTRLNSSHIQKSRMPSSA